MWIDGAEPDPANFLGQDILADNDPQPLKLEVTRAAFHQRQDVINRLRRIAQREFDAVDEAAQHGLHLVGLLGGEFRIDDDGMSVKRAAEIGKAKNCEIGGGDAAVFQIDCCSERKSGDGVELSCRQHRFAYRDADFLDRDL